jgi:hypothetical protein
MYTQHGMMTRLSECIQNLRKRVLLVKGTSSAMTMFAPTENWMAATWSCGGISNTTPSAILWYALPERFETSDLRTRTVATFEQTSP